MKKKLNMQFLNRSSW